MSRQAFFIDHANEAAALPTVQISREDAEVTIKPMRLSDGRCDYFVSFKHGDREVTPHVFRERYKAEYHVALYKWLFGQGDEPDLMQFGPDEWPARRYTDDEQRAFAAINETVTFGKLADAFGCFWNAAIGDAHNRQDATAFAVIGSMAEGFAAVERRLREHGEAK
ncbi:hypothetical protein EN780_03400 [Mesorhizobium sp. M4B.F.Ca.ET.089.01.1.1]|uniref:hypothetical protein n=1 Tax=Mesorhizobium sp. M4B.F.Ca.ET.089.01.1.1 TaxID=2496662 RepID=UPI000FE3C4B1|nr:hypothetical protein [Mesorhizobium sp. M4B.F.Ca.ET.089.01.1.1]RWX70453.1 hypothetical protein EN780_03400 [Mesorhizobium sp. M4B.F.Ca.ET.089.01.1.1]